jgi:hypothetical protein
MDSKHQLLIAAKVLKYAFRIKAAHSIKKPSLGRYGCRIEILPKTLTMGNNFNGYQGFVGL